MGFVRQLTKRKNMKWTTILLLLLISKTSIATQAFNHDNDFLNDDGTSFVGQLQRNEWFNYVLDKQGNIIKYNSKSKNYEYANFVKVNGLNELVPNGVTANDNQLFSTNPSNSISINNKVLKEQIREIFNCYQKKQSL